MTCAFRDCPEPLAYIDRQGYLYCTKHGAEIKEYARCRRLTPAERLQLVQTGRPLSRHEREAIK